MVQKERNSDNFAFSDMLQVCEAYAYVGMLILKHKLIDTSTGIM